MLFLHGYLSSKESFYYQTEFLSERGFRVTAPDFPCFGESAMTDAPYSVGDYALWLKDFMGEAGLEKPHVVCHSFGARVALKLFSQSPALAEKLVITGGAGIVKERSPQYMRRVKLYRAVRKLFPRYAEKHFGSEEYRKLSPMMKESYKKIVNEDLRGCAEKIVHPTLLIYGENDTVTPPDEEGAIFNRLIKSSKLNVMRGDHFCFCRRPDEFNRMVYDFLTEE